MAAKSADKKKRTTNPNRVSVVASDEALDALKTFTDAGLSPDKVVSKALVAYAANDEVKAALAALG